jgi:hypothetical protein
MSVLGALQAVLRDWMNMIFHPDTMPWSRRFGDLLGW